MQTGGLVDVKLTATERASDASDPTITPRQYRRGTIQEFNEGGMKVLYPADNAWVLPVLDTIPSKDIKKRVTAVPPPKAHLIDATGSNNNNGGGLIQQVDPSVPAPNTNWDVNDPRNDKPSHHGGGGGGMEGNDLWDPVLNKLYPVKAAGELDDAGRQALRDWVHSRDAGPKAEASLTAAFNEAQHVRDRRGQFVAMGDKVNVKGDDGKNRRGTVTQLTRGGPQITYADNQDPKVEIIPPIESGRILVAPKSSAHLTPPTTPSLGDYRAQGVGRNGQPADNRIAYQVVPAGGDKPAVLLERVGQMYGIGSAKYKQTAKKMAAEKAERDKLSHDYGIGSKQYLAAVKRHMGNPAVGE